MAILVLLFGLLVSCGTKKLTPDYLNDLSTAIVETRQAQNAATAAVSRLTITAATAIGSSYISQAAADCKSLVDKIVKGDFAGLIPNATLPGCDFSKLVLFGMDLSQSDLRASNLTQVNLNGSNLSGSDLRFANLTKGQFIYASLYGANLSNANLSGALLVGADLRNVNFSNAILKSADLSGAILVGAIFIDADLRTAKLSTSHITQEQVNQAKTTKGAKLPEGITGK